MISIKTKGLLDGQFTRLWKDLYIKASVRDFATELPYPVTMRSYLDCLYGVFEKSYVFTENKFKINVKSECSDFDDRVVCAFSGGKDSVANVLLLSANGYKPILFFVKGINRSYPQELQYAQELAEMLKMQIIVYDISVTGKCDFFENPVKNQFILSLMVDYGLKLNIPNYSFGTFREDKIEIMSSDYMLSDSYELFVAAEDFYKSYIPEFQILNFLNNEAESYYEICNYDVNILNNTFSCMSPLRYKANLRRKNESKYNIALLPNRCGSCHKCCIEAIVLSRMGVMHYPQEFLEHCESVLSKLDDRQRDSIKNKDLADSMDWYDSYYIDKFRKEHSNGS